MRRLWMMTACLVSFTALAADSFIIRIDDRNMRIDAPEKKRDSFGVIIENKSLTDQIAKFTLKGKILKYVSVKSGESETVELENKTTAPVIFVPMAPAFQEVEIRFGIKAYEIPPKE